MKKRIVPLLAGILWSSTVIALVFMLSVCHLMTDNARWFFALVISEGLSAEDDEDIAQGRISNAIAGFIDGREMEDTNALFTDTDMQWLNTRRQHVSVMRKAALGLSAGCLAVLIYWIIRYCLTAGKAAAANGKCRYKSYLFALFAIWLFSGSGLALILSIAAFCCVRASQSSAIPYDDSYAWIGIGCFCTIAIHCIVATLIDDLQIIQPFPIFSSWLPVDSGLLHILITQNSVSYMEGEFMLRYDLRIRTVFLGIAVIFLASGLIVTLLGKRKAKATVRARKESEAL